MANIMVINVRIVACNFVFICVFPYKYMGPYIMEKPPKGGFSKNRLKNYCVILKIPISILPDNCSALFDVNS